MLKPPQDDLPPRLHVDRSEGFADVTFPRHLSDGTCVRELYEFAAEFSDQENANLHVDLTGLSMATSGLVGILVQIQKMFRHSGAQLAITVPDELMLMQFKAMRMDQLLQLFFKREDAIASF